MVGALLRCIKNVGSWEAVISSVPEMLPKTEDGTPTTRDPNMVNVEWSVIWKYKGTPFRA